MGATEAMTGIPPVDAGSDRAVYKQIADRLRERMADGALVPGQKLPSEAALMREFRASRGTVRGALELLTNEGRLHARRGVGVFVRDPSENTLILHDPVGRLKHIRRQHGMGGPLAAEAAAQHLEYRQEVFAREEVPAPAAVAAHLRIDPGTPVFARRRLVQVRRPDAGSEEYQRVQLADSYLPLELATGRIRETDTGPGGTYARLEEHGHHLTHFEETLSFRMPTPAESRQLELGVGVPVIDLIRVAHTATRPVECFLAVMAGDKYRFEYRIDAA